MNENERDNHFRGFAELLCNEEPIARFLDNPIICSSGMRREIVDLIAQRAYDLAWHAVYWQTPDLTEQEAIKALDAIPDLTEWPTPESS